MSVPRIMPAQVLQRDLGTVLSRQWCFLRKYSEATFRWPPGTGGGTSSVFNNDMVSSRAQSCQKNTDRSGAEEGIHHLVMIERDRN